MAKGTAYIKTYPNENYAVSSGIGFRLFYDSLQNKPRNMLLLSNAFAKAKIDSDIFLENMVWPSISPASSRYRFPA